MSIYQKLIQQQAIFEQTKQGIQQRIQTLQSFFTCNPILQETSLNRNPANKNRCRFLKAFTQSPEYVQIGRGHSVQDILGMVDSIRSGRVEILISLYILTERFLCEIDQKRTPIDLKLVVLASFVACVSQSEPNNSQGLTLLSLLLEVDLSFLQQLSTQYLESFGSFGEVCEQEVSFKFKELTATYREL